MIFTIRMKRAGVAALATLGSVAMLAASGRAQDPATRPILDVPVNALVGIQKLAKERHPADLIQDRQYRSSDAGGLWIPYSIYVPRGYDRTRKWPVMVLLHGLNISALQQIRFDGLVDLAESHGYIVVCPTGYSIRSYWGIPNAGTGLVSGEPGADNEQSLGVPIQDLALKDTLAVLAMVRKDYSTDEKRIFVAGHSMGGAGAYFLAAQYPEMWAGVVAISGGGIDDRYAPADRVKHLPFLLLHGSEDQLVQPRSSRASAAEMDRFGIEHVYMEIPGADHELWIRHNAKNWEPVFAFMDNHHRP